MKRSTRSLAPLLCAALALGCAKPGLETALESRPGAARLAMHGRDLGQTPKVVMVKSLDEVLGITASMDQEQLAETRVRVISDTRAEVTFYFGPERSAMAKVLGFPRILVFDYGSATTFEVDRHDLAPGFLGLLDRQAALLQAHFPGVRVFVCGHTDQTGEAAHNAVLSLERAQAVSGSLGGKGVARNLIQAQGFGSAYPVAGNDTAPGRALNRRTEIILPQ